eukprot:962269-Prymnesium_polylepis.1
MIQGMIADANRRSDAGDTRCWQTNRSQGTWIEHRTARRPPADLAMHTQPPSLAGPFEHVDVLTQ